MTCLSSGCVHVLMLLQVVSVQCNEFQVPVIIHSTLYFIKYDESVLESTTPVLPLYPLAKHKMKTGKQTIVFSPKDSNITFPTL